MGGVCWGTYRGTDTCHMDAFKERFVSKQEGVCLLSHNDNLSPVSHSLDITHDVEMCPG